MPEQMPGTPIDLRLSGALWMINRALFHPRGFALGQTSEGSFVLYGDGSEPWRYAASVEENDLFNRFEAVLASKAVDGA